MSCNMKADLLVYVALTDDILQLFADAPIVDFTEN